MSTYKAELSIETLQTIFEALSEAQKSYTTYAAKSASPKLAEYWRNDAAKAEAARLALRSAMGVQ